MAVAPRPTSCLRSIRSIASLRGSNQPAGHRMLPLKGVKVLEFTAFAPVPHCGLMLADFGADVTVIEKSAKDKEPLDNRLKRGKKSVDLNLKDPAAVEKVKEMCRHSDILLDPHRPGVLEKLGLDPVELMKENEGLIVCRLTGYGQDGPLSAMAGHDINFTAVSGVLPTVTGTLAHPPFPPANLLTLAGGGLTAAFGVVAALLQRMTNGGKGCVLDVSLVEGLSYLSTFITLYKDLDLFWARPYGVLNSECPIYRCYKTKDGKFMSVGALEPKFTANFLKALGSSVSVEEVHKSPGEAVKEFEKIFKTKTRDQWSEILKGKDACAVPVLDLDEVGDFPHHRIREAFVRDEAGRWIARPHPRMYSMEELEERKKS